jgi:hypothetical protein
MNPKDDFENSENVNEIIEDVEVVDPQAVIEGDSSSTLPSEGISNDLSTLMAVEGAIKSHLEQLEKLREATRVQREMVESLLQSDPVYMEAAEEAKKGAKVKAEARKRVLDGPGNKQVVQNLKDLKQQNKELSDGLSYYLGEYRRITGANEFEGSDGELREIVLIAKLVKKRS